MGSRKQKGVETMARNVTISLLGPAPYRLAYQEDLESLVAEMERHWEQELAQVLCSKPDLIVVPEACDRYPNFTMEERMRYYEAVSYTHLADPRWTRQPGR